MDVALELESGMELEFATKKSREREEGWSFSSSWELEAVWAQSAGEDWLDAYSY